MKEKPYQDYKRLTKEQMPRVRRLVKQCCNYDGGECIALDDGAGCCCVQMISYSLLCKWFRSAVLPLDPALELSLLGGTPKRCANGGEAFVPGSNRAKYCPVCGKVHQRKMDAAKHRRNYAGRQTAVKQKKRVPTARTSDQYRSSS